MLLVTARVAEDHGQGARPWLTELELHLGDLAPDPDEVRARSGRGEDGCACAALTAGHVAELIDAYGFITAEVRLVTGEES
jgi:hypothetical protein